MNTFYEDAMLMWLKDKERLNAAEQARLVRAAIEAQGKRTSLVAGALAKFGLWLAAARTSRSAGSAKISTKIPLGNRV